MHDRFMRSVWMGLGAVIIMFALFVTLVVMPSHADRREQCEVNGGQLTNEGDCLAKEMFR